MTIIRTIGELIRHNQRVEDVCGKGSASAMRARERHALLLVEWLMCPQPQRTAFNAVFGPPPEETEALDTDPETMVTVSYGRLTSIITSP